MVSAWLFLLLLIPPLGIAGCRLARSPSGVLTWVAGVVTAFAAAACGAACMVFARGPITAGGAWLRVDALSAFHYAVLSAVFLLSSFYARIYFREAIDKNEFPLRRARIFGALWLGALTAITVVLTSNNMGLMWVGLEATTLMTAFLISLNRTAASLEAMWKYLIMCSVGVAFAFMGTLLIAASARGLNGNTSDTLLWTTLMHHAASLSPTPIKVAFLFLLVGFGTKAGLAPMHSWLPDAHSQAPSPVSAMFSGFLLNTALYCIVRYLPIIETATGHSGWSRGLLMNFGILSILVAAVFIVLQDDLKRLLAYHSVEHIGIIALGLGLGGVGTFAALFHTLNHSLCKAVGFFSAGRLGQLYDTHDMRKITGTLRRDPVWGTGLFASFLALIGMAPFALFMSEFQILRSAIDGRSHVAAGLFLAGATIVFIGALRHAIAMAWGESSAGPEQRTSGARDAIIALGPLAFLLLLGLWMPEPIRNALEQAAAIVRGQP